MPLTALRRRAGHAVPGAGDGGARAIGHLTELTDLVAPDVSVVLNVGTAHIGEFGSREAIAQAKGELVAGLRPDGVAVLNADDERVAAMAALAPGSRAHLRHGRRPTYGSRTSCSTGWAVRRSPS